MSVWIEQAKENIEEWGMQRWPELTLALIEEVGELSQAILEYYYEDGDAEEIPEELTDVVAMLYQAYWKLEGKTVEEVVEEE